jgi:hypothetical protein
MKISIQVKFSFDSGADQFVQAQLLHDRFLYIIRGNLRTEPSYKKCLGSARIGNYGQRLSVASTDEGLPTALVVL